ncbi:response regulator [Desulfovibrio sulfodismutans]|uniref:histidine kinase n=1 Tax=Desulfolutivibrio sulfodismutans TaxID=63561 RepID=A0A7K3NLP1_9BACT|nr:response regulator [Desulfolutivibrio sulfodismutans]NDY56763.1 response regulator [Desulfolutivibrio sulfodismutans]
MTNILVADDSALTCAWLERLLPTMGHHVAATVRNGAEAVRLAQSLRPDLVLMDVRMPGDMDGLAAGEHIRSTLDIPVVYMTAHTEEDILGRIMAASPRGFVTKPIQAAQLRLTLEIALRARAERALTSANARFRILADNASDMIFRYRFADNTYEYVNSAITAITGYSPADLCADPLLLFRIIHPESRDYLEREWGKFLQGDIAPTYEFRIMHADGRPRWLFQRNIPVRDESGKVVALDGMVTDVTERKSVEQRLRRDLENADEASRAKTRLLARVGHELRTPLNNIIGMCEVLAEATLPPDQRKCVAAITESGDALARLISQVLDISRMDSGEMELCRGAFDPGALIGEIADDILPRARDKGLRLVVRTGPGLPKTAYGDALAMGRVVRKLADNAVRFTQRGEVELMASLREGPSDPPCLVFRVRDTGEGIDPQDQRRIFEPFATSRQTGGTSHGAGLGLAVAARLAELLGGSLEVESRPGLGSLFTFRAPVELAAQTPTAQASAAGESPPRDEPARLPLCRVLVAEDNPANRNIIALYLEGSPYLADMAVDGAEAVALFRPGVHALALMDIDMPVMDGFEATRNLRLAEARAKVAPIPVIALTAHELPEIRRLMTEAGCTDFLVKPVRKSRLFAAIAQALKVKPPFVEIPAGDSAPPPEVLRLLPAFFNIQSCNLKKMRQALAAGDTTTLRIMGHGLRGAALTYGMGGMAAIGVDIEKAALAGDTASIGAFLDHLEEDIRIQGAKHGCPPSA